VLLRWLLKKLPLLPQLLFWKAVTGQWVFYSYGQEKIYWLHPHVLEGLFSYRNGWLLYTPLMALAIAGMFMSFRIDKALSIAVSVVFALHVYIVFSWWCWYYGSSLSIRPMIDLYPLLAFPLAAAFRRLLGMPWWAWLLTAGICVLLLFNNGLQVWQYDKGMLSGSAMSKKAFWALFLETDPPGHLALTGAYREPDNDRLVRGLPERTQRDTHVVRDIARLNFNDSSGYQYAPGYEGQAFQLSEYAPYSPVIRIDASGVDTRFDHVLNVSSMVRSADFKRAEAFFIISFRQGNDVFGYHAAELGKMDLEANAWQRVDLYIKKPGELPDPGLVETYLWSKGKGLVEIDDLQVRELDCPYSEPR